MADFTTLTMEANHGTQPAPVWVEVGPTANKEVRWSDLATQKNIASAAWPAMIRPAATAIVSYTYAYTADAVGNGFISNAGAIDCPAYSKDNYMWARFNWDNLGTFASAPIFTAYPTTGHGAIARDDGSLLGGKQSGFFTKIVAFSISMNSILLPTEILGQQKLTYGKALGTYAYCSQVMKLIIKICASRPFCFCSSNRLSPESAHSKGFA